MDANFTGKALSERLKAALDKLEDATRDVCVTSDEVLNLLRAQIDDLKTQEPEGLEDNDPL